MADTREPAVGIRSSQTDHPRPKKADLGCGTDVGDGWLNVDLYDGEDVDETVDLDDVPWPYPSDSFELVLMDNVIEHPADREAALHELHRIVEPGGTVVLRFPHWNSPGHYTNPQHTKTITHRTPESEPVAHLFETRSVNVRKVRFGRLFPDSLALFLSAHVGHVISEVELVLEVNP